MSVINASTLLASAGGEYSIARSVRLRAVTQAYFSRTPGSAGNRQRFTLSAWVKLGVLTTPASLLSAYTDASNRDGIQFTGSGQIQVFNIVGGGVSCDIATTPVYRDPSAWYHVVVAVDTTQATAANRVLVYVNGVQVTSFATATYPALNANFTINATVVHNIGRLLLASPTNPFDGYLADVHFIDGQALTPSSFGETNLTTGVWSPKRYGGTYGTNGYRLTFEDNSASSAAAIGKDSGGNGHNWTPTNVSVTAGTSNDSMIDTPTAGNYAVMNPLTRTASTLTVRDGNLFVLNSFSNFQSAMASILLPSSGLWYAEFTVASNTGASNALGFGVANLPNMGAAGSNTWYAYWNASLTLYASGSTQFSGGGALTAGSVVQLAYRSDSGRLWIGVNNVWYNSSGGTTGNPSSNSNPTFDSINLNNPRDLGFFIRAYANSAHANFGQRPFIYTPPTGFQSLQTRNLPAATIARPNQWFDIALAAGASIKTTAEAIYSGSQFLEWIKDRANANNHQLIDTVRGTNAVLQSNTTSADTTYVAPSGSSVGWVWKEGVTPGIDIVTFSGTGSALSVSHSLGVRPSMFIVKARSSTSGFAGNWNVYHDSIGSSAALVMNSTDAALTNAGYWNNSTPNSTQFNLGGYYANALNYVAYLFAEVAGFSRFGAYTGNGLDDGPFVNCGFRPRWVMIKRTDASGDNWVIYDAARSTSNVSLAALSPNVTDAETTVDGIDLVSNGFKIRSSVPSALNASAGTYVFAAFAETPFQNALAR